MKGIYMVSEKDVINIAEELYTAEKTKHPAEPIVDRFEGFSIEDAYKVQMENCLKKQKEGKRIVGKKIGLTSLPMQKMLGVFEPDYGQLFDSMLISDRTVSQSSYLLPKAEGELAFVMKEDISGPQVTPWEVLQAVDYVFPSIEIIDSRVRDWKIKIEDTVADNASSGSFVIGDRYCSPREIDMLSTGMVFIKNGEIISTGTTAEVMGSPVNAVCWLINKLAVFGVGVKKGEIILSGSLTAAIPFAVNDVIEVVFDRLGPTSFRVVE